MGKCRPSCRLPWISAYMDMSTFIGTCEFKCNTPELLDLAGNRLRPPIQKQQHPRTNVYGRSKYESLLGLTESFFHNYLQQTREQVGIRARLPRCADAFLLFLADRKRKPWMNSLGRIQSDALLDSRSCRIAPRELRGYRNAVVLRFPVFCSHLLRHDV